jgi:uncharacterized membrane protein SirB2
MVFIGYGSLIGLALSKVENPGVKKLGAITSGIGLTLLLVAGFGLIAKTKMGYSYTSTWIIVKMIIWLLLGSLVAFINRKPEWAKLLWWVTLLLGFIAVLMVYFFKS